MTSLRPSIKPIRLNKFLVGGSSQPFMLIAGPCVIEGASKTMQAARAIRAIARELHLPFVFKSSYDKANRTSVKSFRGPGLVQGLDILARVRSELGIPVCTDVHSAAEATDAGRVVDMIQIPALLSRQTDLLVAAGQTGKIVNIKKGQFMSPRDIVHAAGKVSQTGNRKIMLTERGVSFGYNNLVSDMRSLAIMRTLGYPVIYDATHSVQRPGGGGDKSAGDREMIPFLARAAVGCGCDGVFMEVHPNPDHALCDGPNMLAIRNLKSLLKTLIKIDQVVKSSRA